MTETQEFILKKAVENRKININTIVNYSAEGNSHREYSAAALNLKELKLLHSELPDSPIMYITAEGIKADKKGLKKYLRTLKLVKFLNDYKAVAALVSILINIFFGFLSFYQKYDYKDLSIKYESLVSKHDSLKLKSSSLEYNLKAYKDTLSNTRHEYNQLRLQQPKAMSKIKSFDDSKN